MGHFTPVMRSATVGDAAIGLNAVHPEHSGRGIGTAMYEFALDGMKDAGLGGDATARKEPNRMIFLRVH